MTWAGAVDRVLWALRSAADQRLGGLRLDRLVLILSLGANLAMAILLARSDVHAPGFGPPPLPKLARFVDHVADSLSAEDAQIFRAAFSRHRAELAQLEAAYDRRRQAIRAALRTRPFDPAALEAAISAGQADRQNADAILRQSLIEAAVTLSPEGRRRLAEGKH